MYPSGTRGLATLSGLIAAALLVSACGATSPQSRTGPASNSPSAGITATPSATASTTSSAAVLYAVVESHTKSPTAGPVYDTVAIAGLDGYARAKTTFVPLTAPYVGCLGPLFPPQAYTAAGHVFFIDGKGIVRSLGLDRVAKQVASFPIGVQQEASFAVSPDGQHLLATILTFPPKPAASDVCAGQGTGFAPGDWSENVYAADAGGSSRLIAHRTWSQADPPKVLSLVGWDSTSPLATFPSAYGTQGGGPVREGWYGNISRLDATTGQVQRQLGSDSCYVTDVAFDGSYVCSDVNGVQVFAADGSVIWKYRAPNQGYMVPRLSPDAKHVAALGPVVIGEDGSNAPIGTGQNPGLSFFCTGWLDSQTMIGWGATPVLSNEMAIVRLTAPSQIVDLGFAGTFVGVVQSS